jgi:hypothetical protein
MRRPPKYLIIYSSISQLPKAYYNPLFKKKKPINANIKIKIKLLN